MHILIDYLVEIKHKDGSLEFKCFTRDNCEWDLGEKFMWSNYNENLMEETVYFIPTNKNNRLSIDIEDETKKCVNIEYWTDKDKDVSLTIHLNTTKEIVPDQIMTIKPKIDYLEQTRFCLRDLVAIESKNYTISFQLEQEEYQNYLKLFVLKIEPEKNLQDKTNETLTISNQIRTFLLKMEHSSEDVETWKDDWRVLSPESSNFTFTADSVHFSGNV
jgi:hypothetical protein